MIKTFIDFSELYKVLDEAQTKVIWEGIGKLIHKKVLELIDSGKNTDGQTYQGYSASYREWKTKKGEYEGYVNLDLSGQMVASIKYRASTTNFTIYLNNGKAIEKAYRLNNTKNWSFMDWGKELDKILWPALQEALYQVGFFK